MRTSQDKRLDRENHEHVVDLEARMTVVEHQESINRQLRSEVVVLVVGLSVSKNGVNGQLNAELWVTTSSLRHELAMAINEGGVNPGVTTFFSGLLFLQVGDLQIRIGAARIRRSRVLPY